MTLSRALPPLDPTPDEARSRLRQELLAPQYNDQNLIQRLLDFLERQINSGVDAASGVGSLPTFVAMLVLVLLLLALGLLLSRARRTASVGRARRGVLTDEVVTAEELRRRAEESLAQGRHGAALVDAFRSLAVRQVERGRLEHSPGATAHEVSMALSSEYPQQRQRIDASADVFDLVMYGEREATREQAVSVLALDDEMAGAR